MKFIHRLKYYLIGFSLGIVLVFFFFKDRGWDWLPGNRVVNFILTNPINIDESLNDLFYKDSIKTDLIFDIIENGEVNFSESQTEEQIKNYKIEYDTLVLNILVSFDDSSSTIVGFNNLKAKNNKNHKSIPLHPSDNLFFNKILKKEIKPSNLFLCQINRHQLEFNFIKSNLEKSKLLWIFSHPYKKPNPIYYCVLSTKEKNILIQMEEGSDKLRLKNAVSYDEKKEIKSLIENINQISCN